MFHGAGFVRRAAALFERFGADRGAMMIDVRGLDAEGGCVRVTWALLAEAGNGPGVPTLPALAALRALAEDRLAWRGAAPCVGVLPLPMIEREFGRLGITTSLVAHTHAPGSVFPPVLGTGFMALPEPVRTVHGPGWSMVLDGMATVAGPSGWLSRLGARLFGFPPAGSSVPLRVTIARTHQGERWTRDFAGRRFTSHLRPGKTPGLLIEQFGPLRFGLTLEVMPEGLRYTPCGWWLGPLPLPRFLAPASHAVETLDAQGRFHFDVKVRLPLRLGRLLGYTGWLVPTPQKALAARPQHAPPPQHSAHPP